MSPFRFVMALSFVVLAGCPSTSGPQGEPGAQGVKGDPGATGPAGTPGAQGEKGDKGDKGDTGSAGAAGTPGTAGAPGAAGQPGAQGPQGAQGLQGPAGAVLVLDGGIVTGPPGSSVLVTPIAVGTAPCPAGGIRVTQLADGGITNVCNGLAGSGPTATTLPVLSPQCATGGVLFTLADGGSYPVCNGVQGPQGVAGQQGPQGLQGIQGVQGQPGTNGTNGMNGTNGAPGAQGIQGPPGTNGTNGSNGATGPTGPPGAVLYLDGGVVVVSAEPLSFAGFTAATYTGALGGYPGANQKCQAEFPGSYFCTHSDYDLSNTAAAPGSVGAWVDRDRGPEGWRYPSGCISNGAWNTNSASVSGTSIDSVAVYSSQTAACSVARPIACCRGASTRIFRGFTTATYTGALGGYPGANQKCQAEFPGSYFCTHSDYDLSNTGMAPGAAGAWVDRDRGPEGWRYPSGCIGNGGWNTNSASVSGIIIDSLAVYSTQTAACSVARPLACCQNR